MKLSDLLREKNIYILLPCGGAGVCGKCRVQLANGETVLACKYEVEEDFDVAGIKTMWNNREISGISVEVNGGNSDIYQEMDGEVSAVALKKKGENTGISLEKSGKKGNLTERPTESDGIKSRVTETAVTKCAVTGESADVKSVGIAIDLGSTTLAFALVDKDGKVIGTFTSENHQRSYGADVISRIKASNEGELLKLKGIIANDLTAGIKRLLARNKTDISGVELITIAGNTTMIHLAMGYSCESLGKYPFTPVTLEEVNTDVKSLLGTDEDIAVKILPGISAFVGGDIVAGIYELGIYKEEKPALLIDLGTNGEMVLGGRDKLLVASTAAGPAFEGGKISCGVPGISGAIYDVEIGLNGRRVKYSTIDGKMPVGICGTGIIALIYELKKNNIIDENGILGDDYFENGYTIANGIKITWQDIREFQMAKAAIRGGIEMLLKEYGITVAELGKLYLAGGFGQFLNVEKAMGVGLLPEDLNCEVISVGNTSLKGAIKYLSEKLTGGITSILNENVREVVLGGNEEFNDIYIKYLGV